MKAVKITSTNLATSSCKNSTGVSIRRCCDTRSRLSKQVKMKMVKQKLQHVALSRRTKGLSHGARSRTTHPCKNFSTQTPILNEISSTGCSPCTDLEKLMASVTSMCFNAWAMCKSNEKGWSTTSCCTRSVWLARSHRSESLSKLAPIEKSTTSSRGSRRRSTSTLSTPAIATSRIAAL